MIYIVKSSPAQGFDGVFRAGYKWSAAGTRVVFTKAPRKDPKVPDLIPTKDDRGADVLSVDAESEALLRADVRISLMLEGSGEEEVITLRKQVAELEARVKELEAQLAEREPKAETKAPESKPAPKK